MNKGGFSWKRAVGITRLKSSISRATGVPLTKSGRQRKIGKIVTPAGVVHCRSCSRWRSRGSCGLPR